MTETTRQSTSAFRWRAVVLAGLIAGLVFLIVEMALIPLAGANIWAPPRMMAAIVMGPEVLPPPATFALGIFLVGMIVHFVLSILYAAILALLVRGQTLAVATLIGAGFGLLLYLVNFFVFTGLFPWFAEARNWVSVLAHLAYGGTAGAAYVWIAERLTTGEAATTPA